MPEGDSGDDEGFEGEEGENTADEDTCRPSDLLRTPIESLPE
jgi:hypothetical protein